MTKAGKYDTCRLRKIKCDERRPTCNACDSKGRVCVFTKENEEIFVQEHIGNIATLERGSSNDSLTAVIPQSNDSIITTPWDASQSLIDLRLKRRKEAETGPGQFLTFKALRGKTSRATHRAMPEAGEVGDGCPHSTPAPSMPSNPQEIMLSGLVSTMGISVLEIAPFGDWIKSQRVCTNNELAIDYMMKSVKLFKNRNGINLEQACEAGQRAIKSLRQRFEVKQDHEGNLSLLNAVMMHYAAEQFLYLGSYYYVPHIHGASRLMKIYHGRWSKNHAVQSIVSSLTEDEMTSAIMSDRSAYLEVYTSPEIPLSSDFHLDSATHAVEHLLLLLPRLVRLVREAAADITKIDIVEQAVTTAIDIYRSPADSYIRQTVAAFSIVKLSSESSIAGPMKEQVFDFPCIQSYTLRLQYHLYRVILCGLLQTLCRMHTHAIAIDLAEMQAADVEAATCIAMCTDYGPHSPASSPLVALKMIIPLQIGFGAWHRLGNRQTSIDTAEYLHAEHMKWWHIHTVRIFHDMWHSVQSDYNRMEVVADAWAGGPLSPWISDCRVPKPVQL